MSISKKVQGKAEASPAPSGQAPSGNLARRDVKQLAMELSEYYNGYAPMFLRSEQREWAQLYLRGQLSDLERNSIEPMVLRERGKDRNAVRAVRQFGQCATAILRCLGQDRQLPAGVSLVYASSLGHTFLDRRLYTLESRFDKAHAAKRKKCGDPSSIKLAYKCEQAGRSKAPANVISFACGDVRQV
jgi:hypothetical protein